MRILIQLIAISSLIGAAEAKELRKCEEIRRACESSIDEKFQGVTEIACPKSKGCKRVPEPLSSQMLSWWSNQSDKCRDYSEMGRAMGKCL